MSSIKYSVVIYPSANNLFQKFYESIDILETNPFIYPLIKEPLAKVEKSMILSKKKRGISVKIGFTTKPSKRKNPAMKSITEILGGAQMLLAISYDIQDSFENFLNTEQRTFLSMLRVIEEHLPYDVHTCTGLGRPSYQRRPFIRAFLAQSFFRISTMEGLRRRLFSDQNLRKICGFHHIPSLSTFSRRMTEYAQSEFLTKLLDDIVHHYLGDKIIGHIARDSTAISAREKPIYKKVEKIPVPKAKRGRPRKDEIRLEKEPSQLEKQAKMTPAKSLSEMNLACAWGCKKNSAGKVSYWKGYKLHLDITDFGVPITAIVTGANVHDSQLAIPMEKLTSEKIFFLYSLMDAAYDAQPIISFIQESDRVPLIDPNKRRKSAREPFTPAQKQRYKSRTVAERANAHLKDWLISDQICVRGYKKVSFILMCGVINLAAIKLLQYYILPDLQKAA